MYRRGLVLGWTVHRIEYQRCGPLVQELMLRSRGDDHHVAGLDLLLLAGHLSQTDAGREGQNLINGMVLET